MLTDPVPVVRTAQLGDYAVTITIRPWVRVQDYGPASGEVTRAVLEVFRNRGVIMPIPQREIRMIGG